MEYDNITGKSWETVSTPLLETGTYFKETDGTGCMP